MAEEVKAITEPEDLGKAIKEDRDEILIEGSLAQKSIRIKATGKVAWAVCIGGLGIAAAMIVLRFMAASAAAAGGMAFIVKEAATPAASEGLGKAAIAAVVIGVAAGVIGALNKLRKYKLEKVGDNRVILRNKKSAVESGVSKDGDSAAAHTE